MHKINPRFLTLLGMILLVAVYRLINSFSVTPMSNFTPIGAMALFGGAYFSSRSKAYLLPLATLWLSDIVLNRFLFFGEWKLFYDGFYWVYGTFALTVLLGTWLLRKITPNRVILAGVLAAFLHWLITDFGVWLEGITYPKTQAGFIACYVAALPYLKNMLLGNLFFSAALFGSFEWAQRQFPALSPEKM